MGYLNRKCRSVNMTSTAASSGSKTSSPPAARRSSGLAASALWPRRPGQAARTGAKRPARAEPALGTNARSSNRVGYFSSVPGPAPGLGVIVLIVSYSVTRTTPGIGSSITSMIVSSMTGAA